MRPRSSIVSAFQRAGVQEQRLGVRAAHSVRSGSVSHRQASDLSSTTPTAIQNCKPLTVLCPLRLLPSGPSTRGPRC